MTSVRMREDTFTNRNVNQGKVWPAVINHVQRGSRRSSACPGFSDLGGKRILGPCSGFPLHSRGHIDWFIKDLAVVVFTVVVVVVVLVIPIDLPRKVDLRIRSDTLTVGIHPGPAYMAPVVVVYQRDVLMVVSRYMLKKLKLKDEVNIFTDKPTFQRRTIGQYFFVSASLLLRTKARAAFKD